MPKSVTQVVHFYKIKSHNDILGNEGADALAFQAAMPPHGADTSLNQAENPFFPSLLACYTS
eukprot:104031-Pelagomonas_calceolata.AAC.1